MTNVLIRWRRPWHSIRSILQETLSRRSSRCIPNRWRTLTTFFTLMWYIHNLFTIKEVEKGKEPHVSSVSFVCDVRTLRVFRTVGGSSSGVPRDYVVPVDPDHYKRTVLWFLVTWSGSVWVHRTGGHDSTVGKRWVPGLSSLVLCVSFVALLEPDLKRTRLGLRLVFNTLVELLMKYSTTGLVIVLSHPVQ